MRIAILSVVVIAVVAILGGVFWMNQSQPQVELSPAMLNVEGADIGGPFELVTQDGERVTSDALIDGPTLIYFGYTFCPDVCPLDLQKMAHAVDVLEERGVEIKPVFITIDPERDTVEELAGWADSVHPDLVALTGSPEEIKAAADAYKVYYQKAHVEGSAAGYLMDHTAFFYLMTPERGITAMFRHEATAEDLATDIERVVRAL
ncbi:MAG TPA: SCO family protein [Paracoccaceae bacterium]|nr:SCO family protein [Paracoccaceae bacterium]